MHVQASGAAVVHGGGIGVTEGEQQRQDHGVGPRKVYQGLRRREDGGFGRPGLSVFSVLSVLSVLLAQFVVALRANPSGRSATT